MLWEARWVMVSRRKLTAAWISRSALLACEMLLSSQEFDLNRPAISEVSWSSCLHRILLHFRATSETSAISTTISRILLNLSVWDNHHQFKALKICFIRINPTSWWDAKDIFTRFRWNLILIARWGARRKKGLKCSLRLCWREEKGFQIT